MGFYIRKSLSFGPLRFNLSRSGIGVSAGIKGFRVGTGPRGNYVHAGAGGFYYRATLPNGNGGSGSPRSSPPPSAAANDLRDIESSDVASMTDTDSGGLLAELNEKHRKTRLWPIALTLGLITLAAGGGFASLNGEAPIPPRPSHVIPGAFLLLLTIPAAYLDVRRKTTVLFYDLQEPVLPAVEGLHAAFETLSACAKAWHIGAEGRSADLKYTAGANTLVRRVSIGLTDSAPPYFKTNVRVLCVPVGRQRLFLLPDRMLVYDANGVGAVMYADIELSAEKSRFVEEEGVPRDAQVVDRTWRYVNKKGGPDKRFRDNPEIPIALYEHLSLCSRSGLNERLQFSRVGVSEGFIAAVQKLASALKEAEGATARTDTSTTALASGQLEHQDSIPSNGSAGGPFYIFEESVKGPFTRDDLLEFHRTGRINAETAVCSQDHQWKRFDQLFP